LEIVGNSLGQGTGNRSRHGIQRIKHRGLGVRQSPKKMVSGRPDKTLDTVQHGRRKRRQIKLFEDAQVSVDWTGVKRIAEITSTDWQTHLGKLTLELWEWPGGKVLELSTKVSSDAGSLTYTELQQLVKTKQLAMSPDQRVKTSIALEAITHAAPH
jgi:hypothetical protein